MSNVKYHLIEGESVSNVTAFFPNEDEPIKSADSNHPHWSGIIAGLQAGDESVYALFDVRGGIGAKLRRLSDRITTDGGNIYFDGDLIDDVLSQQILRFLDAGVDDYKPLVNFMSKIAENPSEHSKENLYRWLKTHDFSITADGDIVGYKGVVMMHNDDGTNEYQSKHRGPAIVDGVSVNGAVPNNPGSIVEMARSKVTHDPSVGCHTGLHVGTWDYANGFAKYVLEVHVNPRDVVSVPTENSDAKMRVCRYKVVQEINKPYEDVVVKPAEDYVDAGWQGDVGYKPW
jgi:hypothetical protein